MNIAFGGEFFCLSVLSFGFGLLFCYLFLCYGVFFLFLLGLGWFVSLSLGFGVCGGCWCGVFFAGFVGGWVVAGLISCVLLFGHFIFFVLVFWALFLLCLRVWFFILFSFCFFFFVSWVCFFWFSACYEVGLGLCFVFGFGGDYLLWRCCGFVVVERNSSCNIVLSNFYVSVSVNTDYDKSLQMILPPKPRGLMCMPVFGRKCLFGGYFWGLLVCCVWRLFSFIWLGLVWVISVFFGCVWLSWIFGLFFFVAVCLFLVGGYFIVPPLRGLLWVCSLWGGLGFGLRRLSCVWHCFVLSVLSCAFCCATWDLKCGVFFCVYVGLSLWHGGSCPLSVWFRASLLYMLLSPWCVRSSFCVLLFIVVILCF